MNNDSTLIRDHGKKLAIEIKEIKIKLRTDKTLTISQMANLQSKLSIKRNSFRSCMILTHYFKGNTFRFGEPLLDYPHITKEQRSEIYRDPKKYSIWQGRRASLSSAVYEAKKYFFSNEEGSKQFNEWLMT